MPLFNQRLVWGLFLSGAVAVFVGGIFELGLFGTWQAKLADKLFLPRPPAEDIVILAIDDESLQAIGQWPWPRAVHGRALTFLASLQPRAVGYDVIFSEPSRLGASDDAALAAALKKLPMILPLEGAPLNLGPNQKFLAEDFITSLEIFKQAAVGQGSVNVLADEDGVVRRLPLFIEGRGQKIPAFSLAMAYQADVSLPDKLGPVLRLNFAGPPGTFRTVSFLDVYEQRALPEVFRDKLVLVGLTSQDLHDNQMTPFSLGQAMAGVEIHANALDTLISGKFLREVSRYNVWLAIFLLSLAVALIFNFVSRIWLAAGLNLLVGALYILAALFAFGQGLIWNLVYPSLALVLSLIIVLAYYYFSESKEKRYLRQSFQFYLEGSVIEEIIKDPAKLRLGGEKKEMSVLFSDIRGFTSLSEKNDPAMMVSLLNEYFTAMTEVIFETGGVLDKFMGDAIMAFWGAPKNEPNHAFLACEAALKMRERLVKLNQDWSGRSWPAIEIGVGINSGQMIVGNMGSAKRFDYTVIGDNVNLASRLEGLNKQYQAGIIISRFTFERVKDKFECAYLDKVSVKGKETAVEIYHLTGKK